MTARRALPNRSELAGLLTDAAHSVSGVLTSAYPTTASRSYLHPVLGALAAGPRVVGELSARLERSMADEPLRGTPAGLFTLASYASALGWLTESLAELTTSVDQICTRVGITTQPPEPHFAEPTPVEQGSGFGFSFSAPESAAVRAAAEAADLAPDEYVEVLSQSMLAASRITGDCMEITSGLLEDASYILSEASDDVRIGDGPESLPTLVRSLLARIRAAE